MLSRTSPVLITFLAHLLNKSSCRQQSYTYMTDKYSSDLKKKEMKKEISSVFRMLSQPVHSHQANLQRRTLISVRHIVYGHILKWLDLKDKVNFQFYDVTAWLTNNCNTYVAQYLKKYQTMKFRQLLERNMRKIFHGKSYTKCGGETSPRPFSEKLKLSIITVSVV